jgi:hypothetical protein
MKTTNPPVSSGERQVAKVLRDVLTTAEFTDIVDLKETLKSRCARLHLPYDAGVISRALDLVGSNRSLLTPATRRFPRRPPESDTASLSRADATALVEELSRRGLFRTRPAFR